MLLSLSLTRVITLEVSTHLPLLDILCYSLCFSDIPYYILTRVVHVNLVYTLWNTIDSEPAWPISSSITGVAHWCYVDYYWWITLSPTGYPLSWPSTYPLLVLLYLHLTSESLISSILEDHIHYHLPPPWPLMNYSVLDVVHLCQPSVLSLKLVYQWLFTSVRDYNLVKTVVISYSRVVL